VRQIEDGEKTASELCRELELNLQTISRWRSQLASQGDKAFPGKGRQSGAAAELRRLQAENRKLKEENEILKKAAAYFARDVR